MRCGWLASSLVVTTARSAAMQQWVIQAISGSRQVSQREKSATQRSHDCYASSVYHSSQTAVTSLLFYSLLFHIPGRWIILLRHACHLPRTHTATSVPIVVDYRTNAGRSLRSTTFSTSATSSSKTQRKRIRILCIIFVESDCPIVFPTFWISMT